MEDVDDSCYWRKIDQRRRTAQASVKSWRESRSMSRKPQSNQELQAANIEHLIADFDDEEH